MHPLLRHGRSRQALAAVLLAVVPLMVAAQGAGVRSMMDEPALLLGSSTPGYLGVELNDVDTARAQSLKLKEPRGAVITLIDHDAPAGKVGLRVNDVVIEMNGKAIADADTMRRMLRDVTAGHKLRLVVVRDGQPTKIVVELADRKTIEHEAWNHLDGSTAGFGTPGAQMGMLPEGAGDAPTSTGWHIPFFGGSLNVGVLVEPLTRQMAEVLGVKSGLMIKQVAQRSAAHVAGLKALDVIVKVGAEPVTTLSSWDRAMRSNQGRSVEVTILRDRKLQTLQLQVDSKRHG